MHGAISKQWFGRLLVAVWGAAVVSVSIAANARPGWIRALAASPDRVREGKLWFLGLSAVLVDRPVLVSLLSFGALAALALFVCGTRTFWTSAFLGQVVATLLVYVFIGAARWIVPGAFNSSLVSPDYGVSTVSAAWLGSIATVAWRRRGRTRIGKSSIAVSCVAVGLFAYTVRPDVTVLSSEHLVAFALGIGGSIPGLWRRMLDAICRRPFREARALVRSLSAGRSPVPAATLMLLPLIVAIAAVPTGLAALRKQIASHLPPTVTRCASDWNHSRSASRPSLSEGSISVVSLSIARRSTWPLSCRYTFIERERAIVVLGLWRGGRVSRWTVSTYRRLDSRPTRNATLQASGRIRLLDRDAKRLRLSS